MTRGSNRGAALVAVLIAPLLCPAILHADAKADYERFFGEEEREVRATTSTEDDVAFARKLHRKAISETASRELSLLLCDKTIEFGLKDPSGYQQVLEAIERVNTRWGPTTRTPKWVLKKLTTLRLLYSRSTGQEKKKFGRRYLNALTIRAKAAIDQGKREEAHEFFQQAVSVGKSIDDPWTDQIAARMKRNEQAMGRTLNPPTQRTSQPAKRERTPSARLWSSKPSPRPAQREPQVEAGSKSEKGVHTGEGDTSGIFPCCFYPCLVGCAGGVLGLVLCSIHKKRREAEAKALTAGIAAVRKQVSKCHSRIETSPQSLCKQYLARLDIPLQDDSKPPPDAAKASKNFVKGLRQIKKLLNNHPEIDSRHLDFADQVREADVGEAETLAKKLTEVKVGCPSCKTGLFASLLYLGKKVQCPDCKHTFTMTSSMLERPP